MSLLVRRTISTQKCLFSLPRRAIPIQQASPFSTKTPQPRKPRTPRIPPPLLSPKTAKKQATSSSTWPRPNQIPYQPNAANAMNFIGKIEMPIQFHATPDGKHLSATSIAQQNGKSENTLTIPVVFEGDLAHTVACHVRLNDCVYVTGRLSLEPLPFVLTENQGKFYVVGNELSFVQGLDSKGGDSGEIDVGNDHVMNELVGNGKVKVAKKGSRVVSKEAKPVEDGIAMKEVVGNWISMVGKGGKDGEELELDDMIEEKQIEVLNNAKKLSSNVTGTIKDGDAVPDPWKDLLKNPKGWFDNREKKKSGLLNASFPDFKNIKNGTALWLKSAPEGVLVELEGLNVVAQVQVPKGRPAKGAKVKNEDSWKSLVENPNKWFDNRTKKASTKSPDFKHKDTGEALWLNSSPEWVLSQLPPSKNELNVSAGNKKPLEGLDVVAQVQVPKWPPAKGVKVKNEDSWKSLVENPNKWWDCRSRKTSIKSPDFKHKDTGEVLWLNSSPEWVLSQLPPLIIEQNISSSNKKPLVGPYFDAQVQVPKRPPAKGAKVKNEDSWKSLVENPNKWWDCRSRKTSIKSPDFKHKDTGEVLWLNSSPEWALSQLPPLKNEQNVSSSNKKPLVGPYLDAQVQVPKWPPAKGAKVKNEDSWKSLVENPNKWWDCRPRKTSIKSPDFKHKDTGEALWLNSSPGWVLSQLPPLKNEHNVSSSNKKVVERLDVDAQVQVPKRLPAKGGKGKNEDSWKSLVANPDKWWDNRSGKISNKSPDFKHKDTGEVLWLSTCPAWLLSQMPPPKNRQNVYSGNKKACVA